MVSHFNYIQSNNQNPLGLPFGQSHLPNARMNLLHIDNQEMHLNMIQSTIFDHQNKLLESGFLHLCSRSLIFDSDQINVPLHKIRYNQQLHIDQFSGDQLISLINSNGQGQTTQQNFFSSKQPEQNPKTNGVNSQKQGNDINKWQTQPSGGPYNDNSTSPLNIQDQQQPSSKGQSHNTSQTQQKVKITVKKHSQQQTKNKTSDSIGAISPSKKSQFQQIKFEDPKKLQYLKEFYTFLTQHFIQAQQQTQQNNMSITSFQEQISELQILLLSVKQIIRIPRCPPGAQYLEKEGSLSKFQQDTGPKYSLFILNEEFGRQTQFLHNLMQFTQPDSMSQNQNLYISEDDILKKYIDSERKKFMQYVKHTEQSTGQKFLIKQVVKRVTVEGEHTYLFLMKQELNNQYSIELLPIMNAPNQTTQLTIPLQQIKYALSYRYLFEYQSMRIVTFNNLEEYIIVFKNHQQFQKSIDLIQKFSTNLQNEQILRTDYYQQLWIDGGISNAEYLLYVNFLSHRSFNDLTQYPVFPWVISDYKNSQLNLQKDSTFRDLSKPVGALSADKLEQFKSKYFEIINKSSTLINTVNSSNEGEKPYMYLSHYSTPGIVLYYLIRQMPTYLLKIQNEGYGGPPDRMFFDVGMSWHNGLKVLADNKELIPEFYFGEGQFLRNLNQAELGLNHLEEKVNDVTLPSWANSHLDFILKNRQALESNQVSASLHLWIDLVFGYQQRGEKASIANNLFQPSTLEENIDFSQISSPLERQAIEAQIRNFGQCPVQTFRDAPHPERQYRSIHLNKGQQLNPSQGLEQQCELLQQEIETLKKASGEVNQKNEEIVVKLQQEFNHLDEVRKKRITKYKEEGDQQIKKYKQIVEFLKNQKQQVKTEAEVQFKQKENQYLQIIEQLKAQISSSNKSISNHQQLQPLQQQQQKQVAQLNNLIDKHPGSVEYLKSLDTLPFQKETLTKNSVSNARDSKKKSAQIVSGSSQGSRLGVQLVTDKEDIKKRHKVCSCLDIIKRAFARQSQGLPFSQHIDNQSQNKIPNTGDLTSLAFMNKGQVTSNNFAQAAGGINGPQASDKPMQVRNSPQQEEHIFRFIQRNEFLQKKFAPKKDFFLNKNNRTIHNLSIKTILEGNEVKFECGLCQSLCSHILTVDCCKAPICLQCSQELCDQYEIEGSLNYCIFCNKNIERIYLIRDPYQTEQRAIAKLTLEKVKKRDKESNLQNKPNIRPSKADQSIRISDVNNRSLSAVKPHKIDFISDLMKTAASLKRNMDFCGTDPALKTVFDDIFMSSTSSNESPSGIIDSKSLENQEYSTKDYTNHNTGNPTDTLINNNNNNNSKYIISNEVDISGLNATVTNESKINEVPKYIGSRKRIQHIKKICGGTTSQKKKEKIQGNLGPLDSSQFNVGNDILGDDNFLPLSKRLRSKKAANNENINTQNQSQLQTTSNSPGFNKLSRRIRKN